MSKRIYLDNNASAPLIPSVLNACQKELQFLINNPSSSHAFGQEAKARLDSARRKIASYFNVKPHECLFTSSGTESMNTLIKGCLAKKRGHIITSSVEHSAVYNTLKSLEGFDVSYLDPGPWGAVQAHQVQEALRPDTCLITLMAVNNETGVKTDLDAIGKLASAHGCPFVVDGVAALAKHPIDLSYISAIGFSGHKIHAPPGIGLIVVKPSFKFTPLIDGGAQEYGLRGGTESLVLIKGLEAAFDALSGADHVEELGRYFEQELLKKFLGVEINGTGPRLSQTVNAYFPTIDGETLLMALDQKGVQASLGSACTAGALEPSRVLLNMGYPTQRVRRSLRFSFSRINTKAEVEEALDILGEICRRSSRPAPNHFGSPSSD